MKIPFLCEEQDWLMKSESISYHHLDSDGDEEEALEQAIGVEDEGDSCLLRSSRARAWRSPPAPGDGEPMLGPYWRRSTARCGKAQEVWAIGSKREDKSYVTGREVAMPDGMFPIERDVGAGVACGNGGGGGWGSSNVARWPCKYESSAWRFTTCFNKCFQKCNYIIVIINGIIQ